MSRRLTIVLLAVLVLTQSPVSAADDLAGQASVIDGDTLEIRGTRIRLWGIDTPESSQFCRDGRTGQLLTPERTSCPAHGNLHTRAPIAWDHVVRTNKKGPEL
jgi:hypothetical protein